jgi:putative transcriptional regulator
MTDDLTIDGYLENQLLVAMPSMLDPNFARSVTLLCQHSSEGAIGITINRESDFTLGEIFDQLKVECTDQALRAQPVLEGGPVNPERGFVLHSPSKEFESSMQLPGGAIAVTTSRDVLAAIAAGEGPEHYLVALGYAGWSDGQLENELRENAWLSVPADQAIVFDAPLKDRWNRAVGNLGVDISHLHDSGGRA